MPGGGYGQFLCAIRQVSLVSVRPAKFKPFFSLASQFPSGPGRAIPHLGLFFHKGGLATYPSARWKIKHPQVVTFTIRSTPILLADASLSFSSRKKRWIGGRFHGSRFRHIRFRMRRNLLGGDLLGNEPALQNPTLCPEFFHIVETSSRRLGGFWFL